MPLYMDVHNLQGTTTAQVDQAHAADLKEQGKYGVKYLKYWFNESHGKAFCLVDAPSPEAAQLVHREAHGQVAERIIEADPELVEAFVGGGETSPSGAVLAPGGAGVRVRRENDDGVAGRELPFSWFCGLVHRLHAPERRCIHLRNLCTGG